MLFKSFALFAAVAVEFAPALAAPTPDAPSCKSHADETQFNLSCHVFFLVVKRDALPQPRQLISVSASEHLIVFKLC
jgi:hypothetical protein